MSWPADPEPLPHPVADNHTHLDAILAETDAAGWRRGTDGPSDGASDGLSAGPAAGLPQVPADLTVADHLARAAAVGVDRVLTVGCDLPAIVWTVAAVQEHPAVLGAVAIHPNEAVLHAGVREVAPDGLDPHALPRHDVPLDEAIGQVAAAARAQERIRAIGETGLDHFRAAERGRAVQRDAFRAHLALAKELGLPVQIHDRQAHDDVLDVLARDGAPERTVFHCFSGDAELARFAVAQGWYLSFAGPVTFTSSTDLRAALHEVPLSRLLVETDAPYLAPHPARGRPNAPYLLAATVRAMAAELGRDVADLARALDRTTEQVYGPW